MADVSPTMIVFPSWSLDWVYCSLVLELIETEPNVDRLMPVLSHFATCPCRNFAAWPTTREERRRLRAYAPVWRLPATMPCVRGEIDLTIAYLARRRAVAWHPATRTLEPGPAFRDRFGLPDAEAELVAILRRCSLAIQANPTN